MRQAASQRLPLTTPQKILFWILLGALSAYFAESVAGSTMFPFTTGTGLVFVLPVYGLHIVVLSAITYRFGKPRFQTLYAAGMLCGMYEAYITKVLWISNSPDGPLIRLGGVSVLDFLVLVLFWHPLMAFMLPLNVAERLLTASRSITLGRFSGSARGWIWVAVACGINQGIHSPSPVHSLAAGAVSLIVLLGLTTIWHRAGGDQYEMADLLPTGTTLGLLSMLLLLVYVFLTFQYRSDKLPGAGPQSTIIAIYAVLILLFWLHLRRSKSASDPETGEGLPLRFFGRMLVIVAVSSAIASTILGVFGIKMVVFLTVLVVSALVGLFVFVRFVADLFRTAERLPGMQATIPSV